MTRTETIIRQTESVSARNYHPLPVVLVRGEGCWVWDAEGKRYFDCLSAYSALNHGHRHPELVQALADQAAKITLTSRAFHNDRLGAFLERLCLLAGYERGLPMNSGAEAVETAIKAARKWAYSIKGIPYPEAEIVVCADAFHGRTTTLVGFSTEAQYRDGFGPFAPGFRVIGFGDARALESAITERTAAFLVEPIQGEAGVIIPPSGYLARAREICRKRRVLFMLDEIQTGFGRTGRNFAHEREPGAKPDVMIVGKALGGGLYPVSAVVGSREVLGVFNPGDHGSTFGGNPLASAVAEKAIEILVRDQLADRAERLGARLLAKLGAIGSPHARDIRGRGLMIAVEIREESGPARAFCERLMSLGLLAKDTHGQVIRLAPPLVASENDMDWIADRVAEALA